MMIDNSNYATFLILGEAGTGKSFLTRVIMESFKHLHIKSGNDLSKPSVLCICPTANAAYIVGGKTIESALQLQGSNYTYKKLSAERETDLKYKYDNVQTIFIDEISMVGSGKLAKINYRFQDLADGKDRKLFMGGKSSIVTGDLFQLPPVKDKYIFLNTCLDDRPKIAPSHWDENYKIAFLTEKMRSKGDNAFGEVCDRIARNELTEDDIQFLQTLVRDSPNEQNNEMFKNGDISILVTTNNKREKINRLNLENLLPDEPVVSCISEDKCTNLLNAPPPPESMNYTEARGLPSKLQLKVDAPILITMNDIKYKEDGITNGARGYIDSFQYSEDDPEKLVAIWVVFNDVNVGQRLLREKYQLRAMHQPSNEKAVPIELARTTFEVNQGNHKYVRKQFPMILGYAVTAHKSQGCSLVEVIIDFDAEEEKKRPYIIAGTFYVAITRASKAENVFLKSFKKNFIKADPCVAKKMDAMCITKPYSFFKIFNDDEIFESMDNELKVGYLNINGILDANHNEYLNKDRNLLLLDFLIIAESKLTNDTSDEVLASKLSSYDIKNRFDAGDNKKHMGILILSPKCKGQPKMQFGISRTFEDVSCQVVIQDFGPPIHASFAYVYLRPNTGNMDQIRKILEKYECEMCDFIIGDLNLNPNIPCEKERLQEMCSNKKSMALKEVTTRQKNQLDHILVDQKWKGKVFVTSFLNFISDHKTIILRLGIDNNCLKDEIIQQMNYRSQNFMKKCAIVTNCKVEGTPSEGKDKVENLIDVTSDDDGSLSIPRIPNFSSLEGQQWLEDDVINSYLALIESNCSNTFSFSSFFYVLLERKGHVGMGWTRNKNIFRKRFVFFPIHQVNHWYLIYCNNESNEIQALDSYEYSNVSSRRAARKEELKKIKNILKYLAMHPDCPPGKIFKEVKKTRHPKQANDNDCGVFLLIFAKYIAFGIQFDFDQSQIATFRVQIKYELENDMLFNPVQNSTCQDHIETSEKTRRTVEEVPSRSLIVPRPPRFSNICSTICWLNSIVQLIIRIMDSSSQHSNLGSFLDFYRSSGTVNSADQLREFLSEKLPYLQTGQQDTFDFFTALSLFPEHQQSEVVSPMLLIMTSKVACIHDETHYNERDNMPEYYISLNVPELYDGLQHAIEDCISCTEYLSEYRCEYCDQYGGTRSNMLKEVHMPKYILIKLNRAMRDEDGTTYKNSGRVRPPAMINVTSKEQSNYSYTLCGIVTHLGSSMDEGHYIAEVKYGNCWFKCNDSSVTKTTFERLSDEGYGYLFEAP